MIKKLILATKIGLTIGLLSFASSALITPIKLYNMKTSSLYVNRMGETQKAALFEDQKQIKAISSDMIEKEINQEKIDKAKGIKTDYAYTESKMPNWSKLSSALLDMQTKLNAMNQETNRYLVPRFYSPYHLPDNLKNNNNMYVMQYSQLATEATKNQQYLLNYYQGDISDNITSATVISHSQEELNLTILNQKFKDNLQFYDNFSKAMFDEASLSYEDIKKTYEYAKTMNLDKFIDNANELNIFKQTVNHDNDTAFTKSALIELGGTIFILAAFLLGLTLPVIWHLDNWLLLLYVLAKEIKLKKINRKNTINYKKMNQTEKKKKINFHQYFKEKKYKNISKIGLTSAIVVIAGAILGCEMYSMDLNLILPFIILAASTPLTYTSIKKENLIKKLNDIQTKMDKLKNNEINFLNTATENTKISDSDPMISNQKQNNLNTKVLKALG